MLPETGTHLRNAIDEQTLYDPVSFITSLLLIAVDQK
jgi:hypothetical protein